MLKFSSLVLVGAIALMPSAGFAQDAGKSGGLGEACKTEMAGVCAGQAGKGGAGFACLVQNQAKLGAACAAAVKTAQANREKVRTACKADADKLCAGTEAKGGRLVQCLRGKQAELTKPCADAIAAVPAPESKK